jgi:hypothetical protein
MTDGATMPAFSDERLIDAAVAVVADRPDQRPLLVVAVASRLEVVVDAPPTPRSPSAGVERRIGSIKLYRLWLKRRSSGLSPCLSSIRRPAAGCGIAGGRSSIFGLFCSMGQEIDPRARPHGPEGTNGNMISARWLIAQRVTYCAHIAEPFGQQSLCAAR